jgi:hypothetical protein
MIKKLLAAIMQICKIFKIIFTKVYDSTTYDILNVGTIYSLCLLEKAFPFGFFDVMTHLVVHLIGKLDICGPINAPWMYPIERAFKYLKGYV